jgi:hypothetical protein
MNNREVQTFTQEPLHKKIKSNRVHTGTTVLRSFSSPVAGRGAAVAGHGAAAVEKHGVLEISSSAVAGRRAPTRARASARSCGNRGGPERESGIVEPQSPLIDGGGSWGGGDGGSATQQREEASSSTVAGRRARASAWPCWSSGGPELEKDRPGAFSSTVACRRAPVQGPGGLLYLGWCGGGGGWERRRAPEEKERGRMGGEKRWGRGSGGASGRCYSCLRDELSSVDLRSSIRASQPGLPVSHFLYEAGRVETDRAERPINGWVD